MTTTSPNTQSLYISNRGTGATWRTSLSNAMVITRREVYDSFRDWRIIVPIVLLTFFFPFLAQFTAGRISSFLAQYGAEYIGEQFIPFLLMVVGFFPISISLVIALETFVGEKERRSLEPLLSTPLTNTELYIGKTLAAMIPPLTASFGGMTFYLLTLYWRGAAWQPPLMLVIQMFILTIVQALVMVAGAVVVSSQTTSSRAANLLASFIVVPMTMIVNAESVIIFLAPDGQSEYGIFALWWIALGMVVAAILLLRVGNSIFNREELLGRTIDTLNIGGIFKKIWRYIHAVDDAGTPAQNPLDWYRRAIPYSLRKMKRPVFVTVAVLAVYFTIGYYIGQLPGYQLPLDNNSIPMDTVTAGGFGGLNENDAFVFIALQNSRVLLLTLFFAAISFGVAAYIITPPVFVILGYLVSQLIPAGYGKLLAAAVIPHGIVEIPTIILATAVIFRLGSIVTRPPQGQTVGQAWMIAWGDTFKIAFGVILPGLIIAALLEAYVTFPILRSVMQGMG